MDRYRLWCRITIVHPGAGGDDTGNAGRDLTLDLGHLRRLPAEHLAEDQYRALACGTGAAER